MKRTIRIISSLMITCLLLYVFPIATYTDNGFVITSSAENIKKPNFKVNSGDKSVIVSWDKIDNADKYYIYCYKGDTKISVNKTVNTKYTVEGLKNGTESSK